MVKLFSVEIRYFKPTIYYSFIYKNMNNIKRVKLKFW
jgi:hypothetical protein